MTSLNQLKRIAESRTDGTASMEHDDDMGPYVELRSDEELPIDTLEDICDDADAVMKIGGQNPFGEYTYQFA